MSQAQIGFLVLVFVATFAVAIWLLGRTAGGATSQRLSRVLGRADSESSAAAEGWVDRVARATKPLAKLSVPDAGYESSALRRRFFNAGVRSPTAPMAFFGLKTVLALGLPMLAFAALTLTRPYFQGAGLLFVLLLASAIGYYLPNYALSKAIARRQREIFENFPDALDLMTVCMEAGLGTEAALNKVADEMVHKTATLSEELRLVNLELRAGAARDRALRNLAMRTGVDEVEGFVTMIIQADRFGTSIAQSLRVHSESVRTLRRQRAEETAAKIPLKLLFPLIFCIFPALMLVIIGPAVIQMMRVVLPAMGGGTP
jgi:tight adherence protein C